MNATAPKTRRPGVVALWVLLAAGGVGVAIAILAAVNRTPAPESPPPTLKHEMGPWTRNVYVLAPENLRRPSMVHALAETRPPRLLQQLIAGYYPAGFDPQMTLSPDGARLYVISTRHPRNVDVIDTYDTRTGKRLARTGLPDVEEVGRGRTRHKLAVVAPDFVSSPEGTRVYLGESTMRRGPVRATAMIGTYDTTTNTLLPESFEVPDCNVRVLLPGPAEQDLSVVCSATSEHRTVPTTNFVYFPTVGEDGAATSFDRLDLALGDVIAWAAMGPAGTIYAVDGMGHVYVIDSISHRVVREIDLELGTKVQTQKVVLSPDGATLYLGAGSLGASSTVDANRILAYDTATWEEVGSVRAEDHFWTMTLGPGGSRIYAPSGELPEGSIQVFDAETLEQFGTIDNVGRAPALVEVPRLGR